jgi:NAD(P)-dependent dehydrogenase (short-subunit alcohol dehydrogenase family)
MTDRAWMFDLTGKKALVTGGAAGIGRALALALAEAGADVAITDLNEQVGAATVERIRGLGRDSVFVRCDVSSGDEVRAMVAEVAARFGRLDIAVNNAGIYTPGLDADYTDDQWSRVIDINLTGVWLSAQAEMKQMSTQDPAGGKIINIASIGATRAISNASYDAAKAGVVHMSGTLGRQWGAYNINVNSISPGYVGTVFGQVRSPEERQRLRDSTPLGHVLRLEDLSGPLLFLASAASDYVTGQNLVVDGGHTLSTWLYPLEERVVPPRVSPDDEIENF